MVPPYVCDSIGYHDSHQDHIAVSQATVAASRKSSCPLYMYDQALPSGMTPYSFRAQSFVDISETIDVKTAAVMAHKSQVAIFGDYWIRGMKGRAAYWGFSLGVQYAEAFEVVKEIQEIASAL